MVASASDMVLVLTGGSSNTDPNESLGGDPSSQPILGTLNNLFDNVSEEEALEGVVDYRCIYIFNNSSSDSFYNVSLYVFSQVEEGASVQIGTEFSDEIQKITVIGNVTGGSFQISYTPPGGSLETRTAAYNINQGVWASNVEAAINSIDTLSCSVTASGTFGNRIFNIQFDDSRSRDLFGVSTTGLTGTGLGISASKSVIGAPINSIPTLLDVETTPPFGITFEDTDSSSRIEIGTLYPEEGFPLWIKRTILPETESIVNDGFSLKILASPIT